MIDLGEKMGRKKLTTPLSENEEKILKRLRKKFSHKIFGEPHGFFTMSDDELEKMNRLTDRNVAQQKPTTFPVREEKMSKRKQHKVRVQQVFFENGGKK